MYSIGVVLYELLTARPPFESSDPRVLARMHQTQPPPPIHTLNPAVPLQLERIVLRALAKDPSQRYPDANAFARAYSVRATGDARTQFNLAPVSVPPDSPLATQRVQPVAAARLAAEEISPTRARRQEGPDVLLWLLGLIAFLCVLGLVPLYVAVYRAYTRPATNLPLFATPTVSVVIGQQVSVPLLVGRPITEAASQAAALGLSVVIAETRVGEATMITTVVEQRPAPGTLLMPGDVISVVVESPRFMQRVVVPPG